MDEAPMVAFDDFSGFDFIQVDERHFYLQTACLERIIHPKLANIAMLQHKHPDDRLGRPGEYLIVSLATTERGWVDLP